MRVVLYFRRSAPSFDGHSSPSYIGANSHDMFSPAFRQNSANCGSTNTTPAFAPWRPLTAPIRRTGRVTRAPAHTPRPLLALKCQTLHIDIDNSQGAVQRGKSAAAWTPGFGRPWSGSRWSSQKQPASRQHVRHKRENSAQYSRLYNVKEAGGDSIVDLSSAPSTFARTQPVEEERQQFDVSLKQRKTANVPRKYDNYSGIHRNHVSLKLHDDISRRNRTHMTIVDPTLHNDAVRGDRTARYHFGDTIAKTRDADIATDVEQFSRGYEEPPCESPDLNRSEKSVRFNVSADVR